MMIIMKGLSQTLQWLTCACLNWLVQTGRYTVWRGKSPKETVTSFKFRLLDWRTSYINWSPVRYRPLQLHERTCDKYWGSLMLSWCYSPTLDHSPTNGIVCARLLIHNDSRFHINVKVIPMFLIGHAPILA